mmetsp:Transcript_19506/g.27211  ORF Transcript_19506/g.27211 Transcript_19506/m.27211 type:complete len:367 (-) Transcript_19506:2-1102(-)
MNTTPLDFVVSTLRPNSFHHDFITVAITVDFRGVLFVVLLDHAHGNHSILQYDGKGFQNVPTKQSLEGNIHTVLCDNKGNLYVGFHHKSLSGIKRIQIEDGTVSTVVSGKIGFKDGPFQTAQFNSFIEKMCIAPNGDIYTVDRFNYAIRKLDMKESSVSTIAGNGHYGYLDGDSKAAMFRFPIGLAIDKHENIYVSDLHSIRKIKDGLVSSFAGGVEKGLQDGALGNARFNYVHEISFDGDGNMIVCDFGNQRIRKIDMRSATVTTIAGSGKEKGIDGVGLQAAFKEPISVSVHGNKMFVLQRDRAVRKITQVVSWCVQRLLWIGKLKHEEEECILASLPSELIKELVDWLCTPGHHYSAEIQASS